MKDILWVVGRGGEQHARSSGRPISHLGLLEVEPLEPRGSRAERDEGRVAHPRVEREVDAAQRAQLAEVVSALDADAGSSRALVRRLLAYVEQLLADMAEEESSVLDLALFRDDAAGVRIEVG